MNTITGDSGIKRLRTFRWAAMSAWTIFVLLVGITLGEVLKEHSLHMALGQAKGVFQEILDARAWNARHGGVYVPLSESVQPNPYLDVPERDLETAEGKKYTLINPAYMTRQIASVGQERAGIGTHITSLDPIRPANVPDSWEKIALESFEKGGTEYYELLERGGDLPTFRYMAPLMTTDACLRCHAKQGYKVGDVRGGISVTIPVDFLIHTLHTDLTILWTILVFIWALGLGVIGMVAHNFSAKQVHLGQLEEMALVDSLTGVNNRRGFLMLAQHDLRVAVRAREPLILLFMDLDGFKPINDTYGHKEGDEVLKTVAGVLMETFRQSDIVGRFGGDEFVVLGPNTRGEGGKTALDRFRSNLEESNQEMDKPYEIEVSIGMVEFDPENPTSLEEMILEADRKMYEDKLLKNKSRV